MKRLSAADMAQRERDLGAGSAENLIAGAVPLSDVSLSPEMRARLAFEERRGAPYTDTEWTDAKRRLVEFFLIAIDWRRDREGVKAP